MRRAVPVLLVIWAAVPAAVPATAAQFAGEVIAEQKIEEGLAGFSGPVGDGDLFGWALTALGDVDDNGVGDFAVGEPLALVNVGAVWVLLMEADGTVSSARRITEGESGFTGTLSGFEFFGAALAPLGDFNGDGVVDLAVGAFHDDDCATWAGAVWLLYLNADGTVKAHDKISALAGWPACPLILSDDFGRGLDVLGDFDGDGVTDLVVGAPGDLDGAEAEPPKFYEWYEQDPGAVYLLFLNADGTVKDHRKISAEAGGFDGDLDDFDYFGSDVATLGDLDGDGVTDIAVSALGDDDGGVISPGPIDGTGAIWVLFLDADGTVKSHSKISRTTGGFDGSSEPIHVAIGHSISALGDQDGDGVTDLLVGSAGSLFGHASGTAWVFFLNADGTVKQQRAIREGESGFVGPLERSAGFGKGVASLGDWDGDGQGDVLVGTYISEEVWRLSLADGRWQDLGQGLAGTNGVPTLVPSGAMMPGDFVRFTLSGGWENSTAHMIVGLAELSAAFKGGVLVPDPGTGVVLALSTGATGSFNVAGVWPSGLPSGLPSWYQDWIVDPAGPQGFAASNAVKGTVP